MSQGLPFGPAVVPDGARRKGWDVALSVVLLVLAAVVGLFGSVLAIFSLAFIDVCPAATCSVDGAVGAQFTAGLVVILAFVVGLIATIVALARRRRGWWIALITGFVVLVIWVLGFVGYFAAVGGAVTDRYDGDVLAGDWRARGRKVIPTIDATPDLVVELAESGFVGAVVGIEKGNVALEDRGGKRRWFPLGAGFLVDGELVVLRAPATARPTRPARTASGSLAAPQQRARVARASRILVEGRHDAELVEKVWGSDLRVEGVVVEYLEGVDRLPETLAELRPGPERRIGVLVDHLVAGSKESRIAQAAAGAHVLVVGHPYVDVWQAVKPARLGLAAWPVIPRGTEWKHGICDALGWPHEDQADIAAAWQRILGSVRDYSDLEPELLGQVEHLIDFVTG